MATLPPPSSPLGHLDLQSICSFWFPSPLFVFSAGWVYARRSFLLFQASQVIGIQLLPIYLLALFWFDSKVSNALSSQSWDGLTKRGILQDSLDLKLYYLGMPDGMPLKVWHAWMNSPILKKHEDEPVASSAALRAVWRLRWRVFNLARWCSSSFPTCLCVAWAFCVFLVECLIFLSVATRSGSYMGVKKTQIAWIENEAPPTLDLTAFSAFFTFFSSLATGVRALAWSARASSSTLSCCSCSACNPARARDFVWMSPASASRASSMWNNLYRIRCRMKSS